MSARWLDPEAIAAAAADPEQRMQMPALDHIDFTRPFVPEEYTQLYYTPVYARLHHEQRLRYNQLFGLRINEYIMMLEADLVGRLLAPLRLRPAVAANASLVRCLDIFIEEEKRHYGCFLALNRACRPELYPEGQERYFSLLPWTARTLFRAVGAVAGRWPFALWYLMAMEESATALARTMRETKVTALGPLEPTFVAVHVEHLRDETRHLQVDGLLAESCLDGAGATERGLQAFLFKRLLRTVTRPTRSGSGVKVVRRLVQDMPELEWYEEDMVRAVLALEHDRAFQTSLFNRAAMPLTFGVFDRTESLRGLGAALVGYDRR